MNIYLSGLISFLIFIILLISISKRKKKDIKNHQNCIQRTIQYLEFSIISNNNPFNNFKKKSDFTLLSHMRLKNIKYIIEEIIRNNIEGDILEAGNWRGGSMLYAKGIIEAYGITNKQIWMYDTFCGFPRNTSINGNYEKNLVIGSFSGLMRSNSVEKVKSLFKVYNLSHGVNLMPGLFQETINSNKIPKLSYIRLDADSYKNTKFLLNNLYEKLNKNGIIELDDYGSYKGCKAAVDEFRKIYKIKNRIHYVYEHPEKDKYYEAIYWRKI